MGAQDDEFGSGSDLAGSLPGGEDLARRAEALIERGLERYARGDLAGALCEWEHAHTVYPMAARALEYIQYVRDNFHSLAAQFRQAAELERQIEASGLPVPHVPGSEDDYEALELEVERTPPLGAVDLPAGVDEGWDLDELVAPLPPPPAQSAPPPIEPLPVVTIAPRGGTNPGTNPGSFAGPLPAPPAEAAPPPVELDLGPIEAGLELAASEPPELDPEPAAEPSLDPALESVGLIGDDDFRTTERAIFSEEMPTIERGSIPLGGVDLSELDEEFEASRTSELPTMRRIEPVADPTPAPSAPSAPPGGVTPAVIVDAELLRPEAGEAAPPDVGACLQEARDALGRQDLVAAAEAADRALDADPDGAVTGRHRDLLVSVYEAHLGDLQLVPVVSAPLDRLGSAGLDHRAGFLLSRIDGMLTFEDILDVAGMPRLDASRILSGLLRAGLIEVRDMVPIL